MRLIALLSALAAALALAGSGSAITNGTKDGDEHPNVGGILVRNNADTGWALVCSGTLVSPTVFLTASHCTSFLEQLGRQVYVTFDSTAVEDEPEGLLQGMPVTNPSYKHGVRDDVSAIVLDDPVGITPAGLPPLGYLDGLKSAGALTQQSKFTSVGYGTHEKVVVKGSGPDWPFEGDREFAVSSYNGLTPQWLKLSMNQAHGDGGTCFGDSGGPTFEGAGAAEGSVVLAVTSTGDIPCYSTNVVSRTDTPSARAFLERFGL
jgi:secreted trypsin-like serine protease